MINKQPKSWREVTISQFIEINLTSQKLKEDECDIHLLSILCDTSIDELEELPYDEYVKLIDSSSFVYTTPSNYIKQVIDTEAGKLYYINNLYNITIGEYIDLENLFTKGFIENFRLILSILYRQKDIKNSLLFPDTFEPYGNWIYHRESLFNNISVGDVFGVVQTFIDFRTNLLEQYDGLFDTGISQEEEEFDVNESVIERAEKRKEEDRQKKLMKWGWDIFLLRLAQNDSTKMDSVTTMPLLQALNILSMKRELEIND
jgi:hypothetical protein